MDNKPESFILTMQVRATTSGKFTTIGLELTNGDIYVGSFVTPMIADKWGGVRVCMTLGSQHGIDGWEPPLIKVAHLGVETGVHAISFNPKTLKVMPSDECIVKDGWQIVHMEDWGSPDKQQAPEVLPLLKKLVSGIEDNGNISNCHELTLSTDWETFREIKKLISRLED